MPVVVALESFDHYGKRSRGESFLVGDYQAKKLMKAGLVTLQGAKNDPRVPSGGKSSASPAGQVSEQTMSRRSRRGGRRRTAAQS